jgi:hypothetical protein
MDLTSLRRLTTGDLLFDGRRLIGAARATAAGFRYHGLLALEDAGSRALTEIGPRLARERKVA